ncbi:MAG: carboxypeptidase regulatory-like domain-containing protein, partial [Candidatus Cloacimonetes bacterium]|nr:carboxypeptidase regulatory-like domain-containing protein [Candidatus Cloacimonadota bacterium]
MTRVDLRPYAAELANVQGDFYVGFISETGGEYGEVHCTTTSPGNFTNSFILTGTDWSLWDGTDLHFRAVAELIVTSTGTVTGFVTRSDTGDPLEGALVSVGTASETTADDGSYTIVADTGVQPVTCELEGYESFSGEVTVLEGEEVILDIELDPAFWPPINLDYTYNPPMPNVILQWDEPEPPARMMDITNNNTTITLGEKDPKAVRGQSLADTYSTVNENTRVLTGYTIYRNEEPIGTAVSTFYLDANVEDGEYEYWVTANYEDPTGESEQSNSVFVTVYAFSDDDIIPLVTKLSGNYPNPFNPTTEISFSIKKDEFVAIDIYNIKGEKVKTLVNGNLEAGYYIIIWDSTDNNNTSVASGIYFYKMKAGR